MLDIRRTTQPEKEITPLPQHGHLGDQAHFQDHWLPNGTRGFPNSKGKGNRQKAKTKEEGDKGQGKGHLNEKHSFWDSLLGQLPESWSCVFAAQSEQLGPDSDLNSLLPICGMSFATRKTSTLDCWTHVKTRSHGQRKSHQLVDQTTIGPKTSQFIRIEVCTCSHAMGHTLL